MAFSDAPYSMNVANGMMAGSEATNSDRAVILALVECVAAYCLAANDVPQTSESE